MVSRDALLNALRSLDYGFKKGTEKSEIWKKKGQTDRLTISKHKVHDPKYAQTVLRKAGMSDDQISNFIASQSV